MKNRTLKIDSNHKLVDNGVGDYDFICKKLGKIRFFPIMVARSFWRKSKLKGAKLQCLCNTKEQS